ncbi:MAG: glycosyltransferase [Phycisphaerae bacterium]|nr:glycosyltransferase [Phycisphaerae bacterium]
MEHTHRERIKKLRVLTINHLFPSKEVRFAGIFISRQGQYLAKHGIECNFLVPRPWAPWPLYRLSRWRKYGPANLLIAPKGLEARLVRYLRPPGIWFARFEYNSTITALKAAAIRWHRENPFDAVLGISMFPDAELAVSIGKKLNLPVATLAIGSDVMLYMKQFPVFWKRLGRALEQVDLPIGVSEAICKELSKTGKCRREPLCAYLGRDNERFLPAEDKNKVRQSLGWAEGDIVAIYVGSLINSKGINELAEAANALLEKYHNFRLVCVGEGPAIEKLVQLRAGIGRDGAVVLPGLLSPQEIPMYLQGADFMVFPSHSEGMPQSVLEAMNCGLPVVATRVGGIPEAVIDGQTGILIDVKNTGQLQAATEKMINDKEFRITAGHKGYLLAKEKFDTEKNVKKFADALRSLVV